MRVLIACEFSGVVREAFRARGHDAWSCDILPAEDGSDRHFLGDVETVFKRKAWDLMIAHPPCRYLCNSGIKWLYIGGRKENGRDEERWDNMMKACRFYNACADAPIPRIALENPRMHPYAEALVARPWPLQFIQPWQHGHGETKATGLRLKHLPLLEPSNVVDGRNPRVHYASPGPDRWKERSRTLKGIAEAMADQWGSL